MSVTSRFGLYTEDDSSTKFIDWRTKINQSNESNMEILDKNIPLTFISEEMPEDLTEHDIWLKEVE